MKNKFFDEETNGPYSLGPELTVTGEREIANEAGLFGLIEIQTDQVLFTFPRVEFLNRDLSLLYGIGPATALKLNQEGYRTINDLLEHPRWQKAARDVIKAIEAGDVARLGHYGANDLQLLSFFEPESIRFVDIETVGLYYIHPVFLIGVLQFENGRGLIHQFLARDFAEERAILFEAAKVLKNAGILISYNGRSFDLPYLKGRMRFHNLEAEFDSWHLDLLRQARKDYRRILPDCRLLTIEKSLLRREREADIPGSAIAEYYNRYIDSGDIAYIRPILEHNAWDLFSMAEFLGLLTVKKSEKVVGNGD